LLPSKFPSRKAFENKKVREVQSITLCLDEMCDIAILFKLFSVVLTEIMVARCGEVKVIENDDS